MLVDSHCHLNYEGLREDVPGVLARARAAGIGRFLNISTKEREWPEVVGLAEQEADVFATVGIHPHEAETHPDVDTAKLVAAASHPKVVGIGETGLDYFYDHSPREQQQTAFRAHIAACRETGLPLIVHTRDAEEDTARILREEMEKGPYTGVIHCFTASQQFAETALELGFYISISGIVTFKSAKDLQETVKTIPQDRLLVETDSPFLAPVPKRGKPCEPAYVTHTAAFVANLRGQTAEELSQASTENFFRLFSKAR
ncbi:MAG TPA: TatD family hydrolase [Pedomonas sp.]|uniref:TatD family hydrolase n=1 Tax=Pedomonas sp. TaxID=2976421 RepID=UPI002F4258EB